ncbi:MAG: SDR family oxidoreductase [Prolixibacteraceae bacterium]|nr:SDR family oxidoreductase [Prolixibacteraceae bacterium]
MVKVAIITGANRGIGKTCAIGFASLGYQTVLIGRDRQKLEKVANKIQTLGKSPEPFVWVMDISQTGLIESGVKDIIEKFRRIDVLVNNAGIYREGTSEISIENFEIQLKINLLGAFGIVKAVLPVMKKQNSGHIFNIASRSGKIGFADSGGYSASKFGLMGFNESLYNELKGTGISVTAICPGWVNTDMAFEAGTPLGSKEMIQTSDIFKTMEWIINLAPYTRVKEVVIESKDG